MERIARETVVTHGSDGFTLSYLADSGEYYHRRYIDYSVPEAMRMFIRHVRQEEGKIMRCVPAPHVVAEEDRIMKMLDVLRQACGAEAEAEAKED
jgi:hypothetical protein